MSIITQLVIFLRIASWKQGRDSLVEDCVTLVSI